MRRGDTTYLNAPAGVDCGAHVEMLSTPPPFGSDSTFWPRYGMWLRTTREARLKAREEQWRTEHNKRKVTKDARTHISASVAPTSLFDCFWRLRIESNYGTIDIQSQDGAKMAAERFRLIGFGRDARLEN